MCLLQSSRHPDLAVGSREPDGVRPLQGEVHFPALARCDARYEARQSCLAATRAAGARAQPGVASSARGYKGRRARSAASFASQDAGMALKRDGPGRRAPATTCDRLWGLPAHRSKAATRASAARPRRPTPTPTCTCGIGHRWGPPRPCASRWPHRPQCQPPGPRCVAWPAGMKIAIALQSEACSIQAAVRPTVLRPQRRHTYAHRLAPSSGSGPVSGCKSCAAGWAPPRQGVSPPPSSRRTNWPVRRYLRRRTGRGMLPACRGQRSHIHPQSQRPPPAPGVAAKAATPMHTCSQSVTTETVPPPPTAQLGGLLVLTHRCAAWSATRAAAGPTGAPGLEDPDPLLRRPPHKPCGAASTATWKVDRITVFSS